MSQVTKTVSVLAALLLVGGTAGCASTGDRAGGTRPITPIVLKVLNTREAGDIQPFVDQVRTLSGGRITLDVTSLWHSTGDKNEQNAVKAVEAGQAAIGFVPTRVFHDLGVSSFDALGAPLTVDSLALEERVLGSTVASTMLRGVEPLGLRGIGLLPGPMRKPVGLTRTLLAPGDYRGARVAMSASAVSARALTALGATPVASRFQGVPVSSYDGIESQIEAVAGNQYDLPGSTITANVNLWARPISLFANAKTFDALPASTRALLRAAAAAALPAAARSQAGSEADAVAQLCRRGIAQFVLATQTQLAQLRTAFAPVYTWLRSSPETATAIDQIDALRPGTDEAASIETPSCAAVGGVSVQANARTPLDGTYTVTTSVADSPTDPQPEAENYGAWVYVFSNGRFAFSQENAPACTWGYGTYSVPGSRFVWDIIDGGGIAPNGAVNKPGEHFEFTWSLYRDKLTLTAPKGGADISPENFRLRPWRRVSTVPTMSLFSRRCPPPAAAFPAVTRLDGTWQTRPSRSELAASPLNEDETNDGNWGTQTLTFADGQYKQTETNPVESGSSAGTYTVAGNVVVLNAENGEVFTMRWSIYRNILTLRRDEALGVGPTPLVLKPWTRIDKSR